MVLTTILIQNQCLWSKVNVKRNCQKNVHDYPLNIRTVIKHVQDNNIEIDNRYIVPYNPFLLLYFQAHINAEICTSVKSIKYIHKYVYKGHDCANVQVTAEDGSVHR